MESTKESFILLETGHTIKGIPFGFKSPHRIPCKGEIVFQTGMVGYPESLTDPSYKIRSLY